MSTSLVVVPSDERDVESQALLRTFQARLVQVGPESITSTSSIPDSSSPDEHKAAGLIELVLGLATTGTITTALTVMSSILKDRRRNHQAFSLELRLAGTPEPVGVLQGQGIGDEATISRLAEILATVVSPSLEAKLKRGDGPEKQP